MKWRCNSKEPSDIYYESLAKQKVMAFKLMCYSKNNSATSIACAMNQHWRSILTKNNLHQIILMCYGFLTVLMINIIIVVRIIFFFNSAKLCRAAYQHPKKLLAHGVTWKGGHGIPKCVQKQETKTTSEHIRVLFTVKSALLMGDNGIPCLVVSSVYYKKLVHYLLMVSLRIEYW